MTWYGLVLGALFIVMLIKPWFNTYHIQMLEKRVKDLEPESSKNN